MSAYCHPSAALADHYLRPDDNVAGARLLWEPEQLEHDSWLFLAVASIVWAASAMDVMNRDRPNRELLRTAVRDLGVPDVLRLSPAAYEAERVAEQERRRAKRKGPKAKPRSRP